MAKSFMTEYRLSDFNRAGQGYYKRVRRDFQGYQRPEPPRIRNRLEESFLEVEGNGRGLQDFALEFILTAADRGHHHLYSATEYDGFAAPFDSGKNGLIGNLDHSVEPGPPGIAAFRYLAKPVLMSQPSSMQGGSKTEVMGGGEFSIVGNAPGLLSFAEHCLDLAEEETPPSTELTYAPGAQLSASSISMVLRRIA